MTSRPLRLQWIGEAWNVTSRVRPFVETTVVYQTLGVSE